MQREQPLKAWFREAANADWANPAAIKAAFGQCQHRRQQPRGL